MDERQFEATMELIVAALKERGYDPYARLYGYIKENEPTYITSHKGARSMIMKLERDEILEELMHYYLENRINRR